MPISWIPLHSTEQIAPLIAQSQQRPQVIFKHSTRCGTSSLALSRLEKATPPAVADFYFLDLIRYRALSQELANRFGVVHESPQVLLIRNGICTYTESHLGISMKDLVEKTA